MKSVLANDAAKIVPQPVTYPARFGGLPAASVKVATGR